MSAITIVNAALGLARERQNQAPDFDIYSSCVVQLEYLLSVLRTEAPINRQKLGKIIVGHIAAREFEESDPEFSDALMRAQNIASAFARGLKVPS
ncbi:immunity protein Tsi6 family protein [Pandoraea pnomenusa]|uniref:immunity protein Tsi6 family protein n=1 Tax=Pandoraea pnomenusa TaxID=93220 RepID=UPI0011474F55|nr:immunity protein Tsi6 family protein [Pandoraea pnomenusa]QDH60181.1 hypothetical protein FKQ53_13390 [Pandoraea pnomenusa]